MDCVIFTNNINLNLNKFSGILSYTQRHLQSEIYAIPHRFCILINCTADVTWPCALFFI